MSVYAKEIIWSVRPPDQIKRGWNTIVNRVSTAAMKHDWHKRMFQDHFRPGALLKYKYKLRSERYMRKKRRLGKMNPLVFSGKTRSRTSAFIRITGRSLLVRGTMYAPWYVKMKPVRKNRPNLGEELTSMTSEETQKIAEICARRAAKQIMKRKRVVQRIR